MLSRIQNAYKQMDSACRACDHDIRIMEVSGMHTRTSFRDGLRTTLPGRMKMLSGPVCPSCIIEPGFYELLFSLAQRDDILLVMLEDVANMPTSRGVIGKVFKEKVRRVGCSLDSLRFAEDESERTVVYVPVGFESTAATTAVCVERAIERGLENFCVMSMHMRMIPVLESAVTEKNHRIDGFLCPSYISTVIGLDSYLPIAEKLSKPCVVAALEPMHLIEGAAEICRQIEQEVSEVKSMFGSVISGKGNTTAMEYVDKYFQVCGGYLRGIGNVSDCAYRLRDEYAQFDGFKRFGIEIKNVEDVSGCRCSEVLWGLIESPICDMFGGKCVPDDPVGPCMAASDGACRAWFRYGRKKR